MFLHFLLKRPHVHINHHCEILRLSKHNKNRKKKFCLNQRLGFLAMIIG